MKVLTQSVKTLSLLVVVLVALNLSGCAVAELAAVAPNLGSLADADSTDSDLITVQVTRTSGDAFISNVNNIARDLGYQVHAMDGKGTTERQVVLVKQSQNILEAAIGRGWQYAVDVKLENDGHTVQVSAQTKGNNHRGDPGTAHKLVEEFKARLVTIYARK
ncbi:MAG: hypothetical protein ACYC48_03290 [Minisyncoccota bacterium]